MDKEFQDIVMEIVNKYGPDLLKDTKRFGFILADYTQGKYKGESHNLRQILEEGVIEKILTSRDPEPLLLNALVSQFSGDYGWTQERARFIVYLGYKALTGKTPEGAVEAGAPRLAAAESSWAEIEEAEPPSWPLTPIVIDPKMPDELLAMARGGSEEDCHALYKIYKGSRGVCSNGFWGRENSAESRKWGILAAERGNLECLAKLSYAYRTDEHSEQIGRPLGRQVFRLEDLEVPDGETPEGMGFKWNYLYAQKSDRPEAQLYVARCYKTGQGVAANLREAEKWFLKSARQDYIKGQYELGAFYAYQKGPTRNKSLGIEWMRRAAENKESGSNNWYNLAWLLWHFKGGDNPEKIEAVKWFKKCLEVKDPYREKARIMLARAYQAGLGGLDKDPGEGLKLLTAAAKENNIEARYELGRAYAYGWGTPADPAEAEKHLRQALKDFYKPAYYELGYLLWNKKEGRAEELEEGIKLLRQASERKDNRALYVLGLAYLDGRGVAKNINEALDWMEKAGEQGHRLAQYWLGTVFWEGKLVLRNEATALKWLRLAAENGHIQAKAKLDSLNQ